MYITLLGVGSSGGTPILGCTCATCESADPRNHRTRCSSLITLDCGHNILIDTCPDLKTQALREQITRVDAVLYTHTHADHLNGIDDLRAFCQLNKQEIPLFGAPEHLAVIARNFGYAIRKSNNFWETPALQLHPVETTFDLFGLPIIPIKLDHGRSFVYGYRIGNIAYLTDVSVIPEQVFALLEGLDTLLLNCLQLQPHHTHIHYDLSLSYAKRIRARRTILIHMTHQLEYNQLNSMLPESITAGYDGMKLEVPLTQGDF